MDVSSLMIRASSILRPDAGVKSSLSVSSSVQPKQKQQPLPSSSSSTTTTTIPKISLLPIPPRAAPTPTQTTTAKGAMATTIASKAKPFMGKKSSPIQSSSSSSSSSSSQATAVVPFNSTSSSSSKPLGASSSAVLPNPSASAPPAVIYATTKSWATASEQLAKEAKYAENEILTLLRTYANTAAHLAALQGGGGGVGSGSSSSSKIIASSTATTAPSRRPAMQSSSSASTVATRAQTGLHDARLTSSLSSSSSLDTGASLGSSLSSFSTLLQDLLVLFETGSVDIDTEKVTLQKELESLKQGVTALKRTIAETVSSSSSGAHPETSSSSTTTTVDPASVRKIATMADHLTARFKDFRNTRRKGYMRLMAQEQALVDDLAVFEETLFLESTSSISAYEEVQLFLKKQQQQALPSSSSTTTTVSKETENGVPPSTSKAVTSEDDVKKQEKPATSTEQQQNGSTTGTNTTTKNTDFSFLPTASPLQATAAEVESQQYGSSSSSSVEQSEGTTGKFSTPTRPKHDGGKEAGEGSSLTPEEKVHDKQIIQQQATSHLSSHHQHHQQHQQQDEELQEITKSIAAIQKRVHQIEDEIVKAGGTHGSWSVEDHATFSAALAVFLSEKGRPHALAVRPSVATAATTTTAAVAGASELLLFPSEVPVFLQRLNSLFYPGGLLGTIITNSTKRDLLLLPPSSNTEATGGAGSTIVGMTKLEGHFNWYMWYRARQVEKLQLVADWRSLKKKETTILSASHEHRQDRSYDDDDSEYTDDDDEDYDDDDGHKNGENEDQQKQPRRLRRQRRRRQHRRASLTASTASTSVGGTTKGADPATRIAVAEWRAKKEAERAGKQAAIKLAKRTALEEKAHQLEVEQIQKKAAISAWKAEQQHQQQEASSTRSSLNSKKVAFGSSSAATATGSSSSAAATAMITPGGTVPTDPSLLQARAALAMEAAKTKRQALDARRKIADEIAQKRGGGIGVGGGGGGGGGGDSLPAYLLEARAAGLVGPPPFVVPPSSSAFFFGKDGALSASNNEHDIFNLWNSLPPDPARPTSASQHHAITPEARLAKLSQSSKASAHATTVASVLPNASGKSYTFGVSSGLRPARAVPAWRKVAGR